MELPFCGFLNLLMTIIRKLFPKIKAIVEKFAKEA
jgi:hypothetical protein